MLLKWLLDIFVLTYVSESRLPFSKHKMHPAGMKVFKCDIPTCTFMSGSRILFTRHVQTHMKEGFVEYYAFLLRDPKSPNPFVDECRNKIAWTICIIALMVGIYVIQVGL